MGFSLKDKFNPRGTKRINLEGHMTISQSFHWKHQLKPLDLVDRVDRISFYNVYHVASSRASDDGSQKGGIKFIPTYSLHGK